MLPCLLVMFGCHQYRAQASQVLPAMESQGQVVWSLAWGMVGEGVPAAQCQAEGLAEVTTSTNLGFALLTVLTLGFAAPQRVEWRCGMPAPSPGLLLPSGQEAVSSIDSAGT